MVLSRCKLSSVLVSPGLLMWLCIKVLLLGDNDIEKRLTGERQTACLLLFVTLIVAGDVN